MRQSATGMYRSVAIALVALAAFDRFYLGGKYMDAAGAMARSVIHFVIG